MNHTPWAHDGVESFLRWLAVKVCRERALGKEKK
jgi:hypothetical protein